MTYLLGFFTLTVLLLVLLRSPPQVTSQVDGTALIRFLEQLAAMESALGDERVVILASKILDAAQALRNNTYRLELSSRVAYAFFVNGKSLREELVGYLFKAALVSYRPTGDEES